MNLIIDIGNSRTKLALFQNNTIVSLCAIKQNDFIKTIKELDRTTSKSIQKAIVSNVGQLKDEEASFLKNHYNVLFLTSETKLPFKNLYETPKTLGVDRMALVAAASKNYKNKNVLIIDAGTCITYDFKNDKNEYLGGAISPGLTLRYKSLHQHTSNLPLLEKKDQAILTGKSTEQSIHVGVSLYTSLEVDAVIDQYCNRYPDLTVILTGGDAHFLSKRLKNSIFATSNFLLEGLNHILAFNNSQ